MTEQKYTAIIKEFIANVKAINLDKNWSYEMILYEIHKIVRLPILLYNIPAKNSIYRARINEDKEKYYKVSDISAPEDKHVQSYGRANKPRQTLFYGSETRPVAYFEFATKLASTIPVGEEFLITAGKWNMKEPLSLALVFNPNIPRTKEYTKKHGQAFDTSLLQLDKDYQAGTKDFFEFIAEEYAKVAEYDVKSYYLTCAYSNAVFMEKSCDGIIYPSVQLDGEGFNVALKSEVTTSLTLEAAVTDSFNVLSQESGIREFKNTGKVESRKISDDKIEWAKAWSRF